jgi:hypothetical protein
MTREPFNHDFSGRIESHILKAVKPTSPGMTSRYKNGILVLVPVEDRHTGFCWTGREDERLFG